MTPDHPPPRLDLPPGLARAVTALGDKDQCRLDDAVTRLHTINARLWTAEDRVRDPGLPAARVADLKREIDQLNAERNALAEQTDDILVTLVQAVHTDIPLHTETIGSVLDRLSVLTLRIWHTERSDTPDPHARRRIPILHRQHNELCAALDSLVADVRTGRVRLPAAARHKLYGASPRHTAEVVASPRLGRVLAFGGLSESGKSTSAEFVQRACGAQRFKIGYLLREAAHRHGLSDPYALSARRQAELLLDELNRFAEGHRDQQLFTIESVHDDASLVELKKLLGDRLRILYLDVSFADRVRRSGSEPHAVAAKDEIKMSRGAHRVATLADHVIDNAGSIIALRAQLHRIARPGTTPALLVATPYGLGLPAPVAAVTSDLVDVLCSHRPAVRLLALTGSSAERNWIPGWSDLDLLVVADAEKAETVADAVARYRIALGGAASVGLTLATGTELTARRLTPRLAFALHQLQEGQPVLHATPGLELPALSRDDLVLAAVQELPQVILTLRRLRAEARPELLRPIYKHVVLACRLLLREHGSWTAGPDNILAASAALPGFPRLSLPPLAEITAAWRDGAPGTVWPPVAVAADQLLAWYAHDLAA